MNHISAQCRPTEITFISSLSILFFIHLKFIYAFVLNFHIKKYIYINIYIYAFSRRFYPKYIIFFLSVYVFPGNRTHNLLRC